MVIVIPSVNIVILIIQLQFLLDAKYLYSTYSKQTEQEHRDRQLYSSYSPKAIKELLRESIKALELCVLHQHGCFLSADQQHTHTHTLTGDVVAILKSYILFLFLFSQLWVIKTAKWNQNFLVGFQKQENLIPSPLTMVRYDMIW